MEKPLRKRDILSIFIGSPGDLQEERKIAYSVVDRINKNVGRNLGIHIELRGWEDTLPGYGNRPQEKINEDLVECDIFVGLLWQRWGTPPGGENGYTSGFEEEYYLALEQRTSNQMLDIFLFFKKMSESLQRDPGEQASKVLNFKESVEKNRKVFFDTFTEATDWKDLFYDVLAGYITKNFIGDHSASKEGEQTKQIEKDTEKDVVDTIQSLEEIRTGLIAEDYYSVDSKNIAKATLYTTSLLYRNVLTDQVLNSKVIHLLYSDRKKIKLQPPESELIFRTLLEDQDDIKTGWYWINPDVNISDVLIHFAEYDVLKGVRLQAIEFLKFVSAEKFREITHNIIENEDTDLANEVAKLYSDFADKNDIEFLKRIANEKQEDLAKIAWSGVVRALMHTKPNDAIDWIVEASDKVRGTFKRYLDKVLIEADLTHAIKLLSIKDNNVRLITLNAIYDQLSIEELQELSKDENMNISSVAFMELIRREQNITEDQIDSHFDKKKQKDKSTYLRIGNALANPFYSQLPDFNHEDVLYEYYKTQDKESLIKEISWDSIKSPIRYAALIDQHYEEFEELLVSDIKSGFDRIKSNTIEKYRENYGEMANGFIETFDKYDDMIRGSFYRDAFRVLSQNAREKDLEIIREYLRSPHFSFFKDDILFYILEIIEKFGNERETDVVLNILEQSDYGIKNNAATLLLKISSYDRKKNAQYLFQEDEISLYKLLLNFSLYEEEVIPVDSVKELTYKPNRTIRLTALAYLAKKFSESHLKEFIVQYPLADGFDFYYYDVICWLDRIIYAPTPIKEYYHKSLIGFLE